MNSKNPKVSSKKEDDSNTLHFTLSGVNVSIANAIRRTILSDIEIIVFKTSPHSENLANFITNTCRINNIHLNEKLILRYGDLSDASNLLNIINEIKNKYS